LDSSKEGGKFLMHIRVVDDDDDGGDCCVVMVLPRKKDQTYKCWNGGTTFNGNELYRLAISKKSRNKEVEELMNSIS